MAVAKLAIDVILAVARWSAAAGLAPVSDRVWERAFNPIITNAPPHVDIDVQNCARIRNPRAAVDAALEQIAGETARIPPTRGTYLPLAG
jgi:hypothetical protein